VSVGFLTGTIGLMTISLPFCSASSLEPEVIPRRFLSSLGSVTRFFSSTTNCANCPTQIGPL